MNSQESKVQTILHVEDSDIDHEALRRSFHKMQIDINISWCRSSLEAHEYLAEEAQSTFGKLKMALPSLILLDLNLPGEDGRSFLKKLRSIPRIAIIPVIILTSSSDPKDVHACFALGANAYLLKPLNPRDLDPVVQAFAQFWLKHAVLPAAPASLVKGTLI